MLTKIKNFCWAALLLLPQATVALALGFWAFLRMLGQLWIKCVEGINEFTSPPKVENTKRFWAKHDWIRYPLRVVLWMFTPLIVLVLPVGAAAIVVSVLVTIDQSTRPDFSVDDRFVNIAKAVKEGGEKPALKDMGATIFTACYHQMEREMESFLGWTPNDIIGLQWWDNRVNRQLGVLHASRVLCETTSIAISKFGSTDEEDGRLVKARQEGFAFVPTSWMFPASEPRYDNGIYLIKEYQSDLRSGNINNATINITNTDIETILLAIANDVMEVPHGRLNARNFTVSWFELDDRVFFAQGAAIVARDALVAIRYAFEGKITEVGAIENLDQAITSLEGAIDYHPWWVMQGDGDAMFADHRAKMSRYITDARKRVADVAQAVAR